MKKSNREEIFEFYQKIENNNCNTRYSNNEIFMLAKASKAVLLKVGLKHKQKSIELISKLDNEIEELSKNIGNDADITTIANRNKISLILFQLSEIL